MTWSSFFDCSVLSWLFHSPPSPSSRDSLVPFCFLPLEWCHLHIWGWYFSWQSWFHLVCTSSSPAFCIMCSAFKLNKQDDNKQPFSILNQLVVPYRVLTVSSWPSYRFLRRQVRWSGIPISLKSFPQFVVIHTVKGFSVVSKTEVDVFLEFSCFLYDPANVDSFISGSCAFSKPSLNIWKFSVHIMLKPSLKHFESYLSMWNEGNCMYFEHSLALPFFEIGIKTDLFHYCGPCWVFQICRHIECSIWTLNFF